MKQVLKRTIISGAAIALIGLPAVASAEDGSTDNTGSGSSDSSETTSPSPSVTPRPDRVRHFETELRDQLEQQQKERESKLADEKSNLQEKLDAAKKKACENHQATINRLMDVMDKRRQNALDRITKISEAVQAFYVKKQLSVANYDDLVAKVTAAKALAESATSAQVAIPSLNCDGDHPRADVTDFKEKRSASIDALRAYRDAVKALLQAVKAAAGTTESPSPTPSATPVEGVQQ